MVWGGGGANTAVGSPLRCPPPFETGASQDVSPPPPADAPSGVPFAAINREHPVNLHGTVQLPSPGRVLAAQWLPGGASVRLLPPHCALSLTCVF